MDRSVWQALAEERILAAHDLLIAKRWASAYYLAGYAVEAGLKSCILVYVAANPKVIFERKTFSEKCWSHSIDELVKLANLEDEHKADGAKNPVLGKNWLIVKTWNEQSRYDLRTQPEAEELYQAITDNANGVMPWIKSRW